MSNSEPTVFGQPSALIFDFDTAGDSSLTTVNPDTYPVGDVEPVPVPGPSPLPAAAVVNPLPTVAAPEEPAHFDEAPVAFPPDQDPAPAAAHIADGDPVNPGWARGVSGDRDEDWDHSAVASAFGGRERAGQGAFSGGVQPAPAKSRRLTPTYGASKPPKEPRKPFFKPRTRDEDGDEPRKKKPKREAKKKQDHKVAFAGGRAKLLMTRYAVWTVLGLLLALGLKQLVLPVRSPSPTTLAAEVGGKLGYNGFPTTAGQSLALLCADTFLNYQSGYGNSDARGEQLNAYCQPSISSNYGWNGQGKMQVVAGPYPAAVELTDKNNAFFTVSAKVSNGKWVYLSVPVYADDKGNLAMSGSPSLVGPPARANVPPGTAKSVQTDTKVTPILSGILPGYFQAWASSDTNALQRYITPDATLGATSGLRGAATYGSITSLMVPTNKDDPDTRDCVVSVVWNIPGGGTWTQDYRVTVKNINGTWSVQDVRGAVRDTNPQNSTAQTPSS